MQYVLKQNLRSLIFTSGTLAPLKPLIAEMDIPNSIELINPHIINEFQVSVKIISRGPDGILLNSNYENRYNSFKLNKNMILNLHFFYRKNKDYLRSLGKTILEFSKIVPDGLLVFFPSYLVMNKSVEFWQSCSDNVWSSIGEQKRIFMEPRAKTKEEFLAIMKDYYATIDDVDSNGAIFMAVMQGKVSEGMDFADMYGRGVIITGNFTILQQCSFY